MDKKARMLLCFVVCLFLLSGVLFAGFFSPLPFFRHLYQDCLYITKGMPKDDVVSILGKYSINKDYNYSYNINNYNWVVPVSPEIHYEVSIGVSTEKFEGNCTAYLKGDKVIYVERIFD